MPELIRARIQKFFWPPTSVSTMSSGRSKLTAPLRMNAPVESRKLNCPWMPETPMVVVLPSSAHLRPFQYSHTTIRSGLPSGLGTTEGSTRPASMRMRASGAANSSLWPRYRAQSNFGSSPKGWKLLPWSTGRKM